MVWALGSFGAEKMKYFSEVIKLYMRNLRVPRVSLGEAPQVTLIVLFLPSAALGLKLLKDRVMSNSSPHAIICRST